jgi:hypothetical protein
VLQLVILLCRSAAPEHQDERTLLLKHTKALKLGKFSPALCVTDIDSALSGHVSRRSDGDLHAPPSPCATRANTRESGHWAREITMSLCIKPGGVVNVIWLLFALAHRRDWVNRSTNPWCWVKGSALTCSCKATDHFQIGPRCNWYGNKPRWSSHRLVSSVIADYSSDIA